MDIIYKKRIFKYWLYIEQNEKQLITQFVQILEFSFKVIYVYK